MARAVACCSICCDEDERVVFNCGNVSCSYQLCGSCIRDAFDDSSGANSSMCQMCGTPAAMDMISAVCGPGGIRAVESKVRSSIEFELRSEMLKKDAAKKDLAEVNTKARQLFNDLADKINLKCPRCKTAFMDYDGCNALVCGVTSCRAAFCAICLRDCGSDAHAHVRKHHGSYFDRAAFERSKANRVKSTVTNFMRSLSDEPFELRQLVENHIEKAKLTEPSGGDGDRRRKISVFVQETRSRLLRTVREDRLALLSDSQEYFRAVGGRIKRADISPRCVIPEDYRLTLVPLDSNIFELVLEFNIIDDKWKGIPIKEIESELKGRPNVEPLINITQALNNAVIAFDRSSSLHQSRRSVSKEQLSENKVCITLWAIDRDGRVSEEQCHFHNPMQVLGLNQNLRMIMLEKHVSVASGSEFMSKPLEHLIGAGEPVAVLTEILRPVPETQDSLNEQQQKVAHPLRLRTAMEVAGPPGTGKTKTIVELVRALLECTDFDVFLLSERNGAINAVAEKFKEASLKIKRDKITVIDPLVWMSLMTYGAGDAMGEWTKLFTLSEKMRYHPELKSLQEKKLQLEHKMSTLAQSMREALSTEIDDFGDKFDCDHAMQRSINIEEDREELSTPLRIISIVSETIQEIKDVFRHNLVKEAIVEDIIVSRSVLLGRLIPIRTWAEKKDKKSTWNAREARRKLRDLLVRFERTLLLELFDAEGARTLQKEKRLVEEEYKALQERLNEELPKSARLHMSTIGSSHKLPVCKKIDLSVGFWRMTLSDSDDSDDEDERQKKTVVIFDEAGCIPSYELLGLSRLGRDIESLILVGDEHQLPPYEASQGRHFRSQQNFIQTVKADVLKEGQKSLLDASALAIDSGKVMLTTQYRVPKDIADILKIRVYKGRYNTCPRAEVPLSGLNVINVPIDQNPRRKYVNSNEVRKGLDLLDELECDRRIRSILIITPYKNQQREFEFQLGRRLDKSIPVLTIDQCQGQEADAVILSLVRKPTRFLTKNRLNVALSRVRKKLYVLVDKLELRDACGDNRWESALLAKDMLTI